MKIQPRVFSLEEANAVIPQLEILFGKLDGKKDVFARRHDELFMHELLVNAEPQHAADDSKHQLDHEAQTLDDLVIKVQRDIAEIHQLGCIIRNLEFGWIDFLTRRGNAMIYFCWKRGEKFIQFYHLLDCNAAERNPLNVSLPHA